jgi:nucleoside-diphosphate-sugar epimerase
LGNLVGNLHVGLRRAGEQSAIEEVASSVGTLAVAQRLLNGGWTVLGVSGQPGLSGERFRWIEADLLQLAAVAQISQTASRLDAIICAAGSSTPRRSGRRQIWQLHVDGPTGLVDALVPAGRRWLRRGDR